MEIVGAIESLKLAKDILKALFALKVTGEVQAQLTEIGNHLMSAQSAALDAQSQQQTMSLRIRELEEQLIKFENWETEKQRYQLEQTKSGVFAYAVKESMQAGEPLHHICSNCYEDGVKSILQTEFVTGFGLRTKCPRCEFSIFG